MYAMRKDGKIFAISGHPNKWTGDTEIDETSQEWLDYAAIRDHVKTDDELLEDAIENNPVMKTLISRLESHIPGLKVSTKVRP